MARLFSIATMVTVSSRPRPAILEEAEIWAPSVQATDRELFTRTVLQPQRIRRLCLGHDRRSRPQGRGWPLPICRRLDSLTLKAAAVQHSSVGSLGG